MDALLDEMSWIIVALKSLGNVSYFRFSDSPVEQSFFVLVVRHLINPRFTVNGWCESNRRKRSVAAGCD